MTTDVDRLSPILGAPPDPTNLPKGCKFRPRCKYATEACRNEVPSYKMEDGHQCKCHLYAGEAVPEKETAPEEAVQTANL